LKRTARDKREGGRRGRGFKGGKEEKNEELGQGQQTILYIMCKRERKKWPLIKLGRVEYGEGLGDYFKAINTIKKKSGNCPGCACAAEN